MGDLAGRSLPGRGGSHGLTRIAAAVADANGHQTKILRRNEVEPGRALFSDGNEFSPVDVESILMGQFDAFFHQFEMVRQRA